MGGVYLSIKINAVEIAISQWEIAIELIVISDWLTALLDSNWLAKSTNRDTPGSVSNVSTGQLTIFDKIKVEVG